MADVMRIFIKNMNDYSLDLASRDELLTLRNESWIAHYEQSEPTNGFGQKLNGYHNSFFKEYAIVVDQELKSRGINPKDKNYIKQNVTR